MVEELSLIEALTERLGSRAAAEAASRAFVDHDLALTNDRWVLSLGAEPGRA